MQDKIDFIKEKQEWCETYIKDTINQDAKFKKKNDSKVCDQVHDLQRQCRIFLRRAEILQNKYSNDIPKEEIDNINSMFKEIRVNLIPKTMNDIKKYRL